MLCGCMGKLLKTHQADLILFYVMTFALSEYLRFFTVSVRGWEKGQKLSTTVINLLLIQ